MKAKRKHISILAFILLIVFLAPISIKAGHHHDKEYSSTFQKGAGKILSERLKPCPICKYEFVIFIVKENCIYKIYQPITQLQKVQLVLQGFKTLIPSYLLRAPPFYYQFS